MHKAKAWKAIHDKKNCKDLEAPEANIEVLEEKLVATEKDLEETRANLVVVTDQKVPTWIPPSLKS